MHRRAVGVPCLELRLPDLAVVNPTVPNPVTLAQEYHRRGLSVVPVPFRSKAPNLKGWQNLRLSEADIPHYFNGQPQNIGVLLVQVGVNNPAVHATSTLPW